jgi:hypothetical protein
VIVKPSAVNSRPRRGHHDSDRSAHERGLCKLGTPREGERPP